MLTVELSVCGVCSACVRACVCGSPEAGARATVVQSYLNTCGRETVQISGANQEL